MIVLGTYDIASADHGDSQCGLSINFNTQTYVYTLAGGGCNTQYVCDQPNNLKCQASTYPDPSSGMSWDVCRCPSTVPICQRGFLPDYPGATTGQVKCITTLGCSQGGTQYSCQIDYAGPGPVLLVECWCQ